MCILYLTVYLQSIIADREGPNHTADQTSAFTCDSAVITTTAASSSRVESIEADVEEYKKNFELWRFLLLSATTEIDRLSHLANPEEASQVRYLHTRIIIRM